MCGIIAVMNGEKGRVQGVDDFMKSAAITGMLRGVDSTGVFQVTKKTVHVHKLPIDGANFLQNRRGNSLLDSADSNMATVLHHRAATKGAVNQDNCHPFEHMNDDRYTVGVHNGSLNNHKSFEDNISFDVDSDWALYRLFRDGNKALSDFNGAFAFVWYDNAEGKNMMHVAVNGKREFHFAPVKGKNVILAASEAGMLYWLANRSGIELEDIICPDAFHTYSFDLDGDLRAFTMEKFEEFKYPVTTYNQQGGYKDNTLPFTHRATTQTRTTGGSGSTGTALAEIGNPPIPSHLKSLQNWGLESDEEVEFHPKPNHSNANATTLFGEVLLECGREVVVLPAYIRGCSDILVRQVNEGKVDSVWAKCRFITEKDRTATLNLHSPTLVETAFEDDDFGDNFKIAGPGNKMITYDEWRDIAQNGCDYCTGAVTMNNALRGDYAWSADGKGVVCEDCCTQTHLITVKEQAVA